jgi:hypothetical protein
LKNSLRFNPNHPQRNNSFHSTVFPGKAPPDARKRPRDCTLGLFAIY